MLKSVYGLVYKQYLHTYRLVEAMRILVQHDPKDIENAFKNNFLEAMKAQKCIHNLGPHQQCWCVNHHLWG